MQLSEKKEEKIKIGDRSSGRCNEKALKMELIDMLDMRVLQESSQLNIVRCNVGRAG